jgi:ribosome-associated heat shock protein Hsp15
MKNDNDPRIDKFLWSVRIFKTRAKAVEACKKNRVIIDGLEAKPSKTVKEGDVITVKKPPVNYTYKVIEFPKSRVGAKLVNNFIEDLTPEEEKKKLLMTDSFFVKRKRGSGRPTKKERRDIDKIKPF